MLKTTLSRRTMLRGAGIGLGLPLLNAMVPELRARSPLLHAVCSPSATTWVFCPVSSFRLMWAAAIHPPITSSFFRTSARTSQSSPASRIPTWMADTRPISAF